MKMHKIKIEGYGEQHIMDIIEILGGKRLSSGAYAVTYKVSEEEVIKVFNDDRGYKRYLDAVLSMPNNPYVPVIDYVLEVTDKYLDKWYMVSMERLYEDQHRSTLFDFRDLVKEYLADDCDEDYDRNIRDVPKQLLPAAIPRSLLSVMDVLKEAGAKGFGYDLHDGNFMARLNGDIVITDPLVY